MTILIKNTNRQYLGLEAKIDESKTTLLTQTFKVEKKYLYLINFWPLGRDINDLCFLQVFTFGLLVENQYDQHQNLSTIRCGLASWEYLCLPYAPFQTIHPCNSPPGILNP